MFDGANGGSPTAPTGDRLLEAVEARRQRVTAALNERGSRSDLGQVFTPAAVASFLADLLDLPASGTMRLLDPGAGVGSLTAAVVSRAIRERPGLNVEVVAFELDEALAPELAATLRTCEVAAAEAGVTVTTELRQDDFIDWASASLAGSLLVDRDEFTACVMNPPYRKMQTNGDDRRAVERIGVPVTNLYAAFLALSSRLLMPGGQLVAITPRSFANGVYFKPFREFFLSEMSFNRLHVYEKRGQVFSVARVLQENVVFHAVRRPPQATVTLSVSNGETDQPLVREVPYEEVIRPSDRNMFVRIPVDHDSLVVAERIAALPARLADLSIEVSTGRVVDFRAREHLRAELAPDSVPLIYPHHLRGGSIDWPRPNSKKPNALAANAATQPLLLPNETYVVVKRFTAKEERRRVVASLFSGGELPGDAIAFENHLNVYHANGRGLSMDFAKGLVAFLNSELVDRYVRQFSGHTQINASDLRELHYPSLEALRDVGRAGGESWPTDDSELEEMLTRSAELAAQRRAGVA